jgi:hypothetical protein
MILDACNIPVSEDGVYDWDIIDIIDQEVLGLVKHEQEEWINRDGKTVTNTKGKIIEVNRTPPAQSSPEEYSAQEPF